VGSGEPPCERVDAEELRAHLRGDEQGENPEIRPERARRNVEPAFEEKERRQERERDDAQTVLLEAV